MRRASNTPKSGKLFDATEKELSRLINEGKLREDKVGLDGLMAEQKMIYKIASSIFESNVGSNKF